MLAVLVLLSLSLLSGNSTPREGAPERRSLKGPTAKRRWLGCCELVLVRCCRVLNAIAGFFHLLTSAFYGPVNCFAGILCRAFLLLATGQCDKQCPHHQRGADDFD